MNQDLLLEVNNLSVAFSMYRGGLQQEALKVISDLSISLRPGEILAIAGASGSGKSLLAHAIMGLLPSNAFVGGELFYKGAPLTPQRQKALRGKEISLIPQSVNYLDPLMRVEKQAQGAGKAPDLAKRQQAVFEKLGLSPVVGKQYPFALSGGMARRVLFSTALLADAQLILADEPTPGMHLSQALEALAILRELADKGKGVVLITHDIDLALGVADQIAVFYAGTTVELTPAAEFAAGRLRHPYAKALWQALPQNDFVPIPGVQPYPGSLPTGCLFAPRCPHCTSSCTGAVPSMQTLGTTQVRCIHPLEEIT